MPTFINSDDETDKLIQDCMRQFHPDLWEMQTKVSCVIATAEIDEGTGEPKGPAVTHDGQPVHATIRVVPSRLRVQGIGDVELTLDGDSWDGLTPEQRVAVIDSQLERLELRRTSEGHARKDDYNRPMFKMKKPDFNITGHYAIVNRHGQNALVVHKVAELLAEDKPVKRQLTMYPEFEA